MQTTGVALLALAAALLCAVAAAPQNGKLTQEQLRAMFQQNFLRFRQFPCKQPQRRSVMVGELLLRKGMLSPSQSVVPPATVVHLCGPSTGCCYSSDMVCGPLSNETVSLPFRLQDAFSESEHTDITINFVNHTRCGCVLRTKDSDSETIDWETNDIP